MWNNLHQKKNTILKGSINRSKDHITEQVRNFNYLGSQISNKKSLNFKAQRRTSRDIPFFLCWDETVPVELRPLTGPLSIPQMIHE
jgi:hypothetical protein